MKAVEKENKIIFQYGINQNNIFITEKALREAIKFFVEVPVILYKKDDKYNENNQPLGVISKVNYYNAPYVFGNIVLYDDYEIGEFKNYGIQVEEHHHEGEIYIIDKFRLLDVIFELL